MIDFRFDYIAVFDIDEVIMPLQHNNWNDMMREIKRKTPEVSDNISTLAFRHALFQYEEKEEVDDVVMKEAIPEWLHVMNHVYRSVRYFPPGFNVKSFHSTERTKIIQNHYAISCLGPCKRHHVDPSLAQLNHYRRGCPRSMKRHCSKFEEKEMDTAVWRIKDQVINNSLTAFGNINIATNIN